MAKLSELQKIEARDLCCARGGREVFRALVFSVDAGALLTLEGPNGAGKTSALRMIAGLLPQTAGTIRFQDKSDAAIEDGEERGRFVAWLGHADGIKAHLTVGENAHFFAALFGGGDPLGALGRVGLAPLAGLPAHYLSAGQRRRLALARLLVTPRPLWLLDEPFAALDSAGRKLIVDLIGEHLKAGGIAIAATHEALGITGQRVPLTEDAP